jgi:non-canonical (house-cleaning) NTP pyrophosphatase
MGLAEITAGALARMWNIHGSFSRDTDVVVGIENGIVHVKCEREFCNDHEYYLDLAVVVVMKPNGNLIITTSSAVQVPPAFVFDAERRGFNKWTVGRLIAQRAKRASPSPPGDPTDPHSIMTGGKVSRTMLLTDALVTAFRQL